MRLCLRVVGVAVVAAVLAGCGGGIAKRPTPTIAATSVVGSPEGNADAHYFAHPDQPAVDADGHLVPDVQRVLDIVTLQGALDSYFKVNNRYPDALDGLFPAFAPSDEQGHVLSAAPLDPETHAPYEYEPSADRLSYRLSAVTSSGERYNGVAPAKP